MTPTIEPKPVGPRALRRWIQQAWQLIGRGLPVWVLLTLGQCVLSALVAHIPALTLLLALVTYFMGVTLSRQLDVGSHEGLLGVGRAWIASLRLTIATACLVGISGMAFVFIGVVLAVLVLTGHARPDFGIKAINFMLWPSYPLQNVLSRIFSPSASVLSFALLLPAFFLGTRLQFPLMSILRLPWKAAYQLSRRSFCVGHQTVMALLAIEWILCCVLGLMGGMVPLLAPLIMAFASAITYVAFREIYLGAAENQSKRQTSKQTALATVVLPLANSQEWVSR